MNLLEARVTVCCDGRAPRTVAADLRLTCVASHCRSVRRGEGPFYGLSLASQGPAASLLESSVFGGLLTSTSSGAWREEGGFEYTRAHLGLPGLALGGPGLGRTLAETEFEGCAGVLYTSWCV